MKTPPNATAWLKLVVLDEGRDAMMAARPTTGCGGDRVAIGHIAKRARCPVGGPHGNQPPFEVRPERPRVRARRLGSL